MCDFKVGDEVVCVDASPCTITNEASNLVEGKKYRIHGFHWDGGLFPDGLRNPLGAGWIARRFRKVQRRDLTEWLSSSVGNTDKIDKRKRVNA